MRRTASMTVAVLVGVAALLLGSESARAAVVPSGFEDRLVTQVAQPTSMAFTPDGRMLITTQPGLLQDFDPETGVRRTLLDLRTLGNGVCSNSERGLLGVAVDPNFGSNGFVYLYYTRKVGATCDGSSDEVNRVSRFSISDANAPSAGTVLVDNIPSPGGNHNGGDLHFGKDGYLYISVGDGGRDYRNDSGSAGANDASRDRHVLLGKILRITRDGGIPPDNPNANATNRARCALTGRTAPGNVCEETFAMGLRNPFRMAFDPDAAGTEPVFNINDVGQNAWEEIDLGQKGADYGWNLCEGTHDNPDRPGAVACGSSATYTPPIAEYSHTSGCSSITGAAFVPDGAWPASYNDSYLFGDYVCGKIFRLTPRAAGPGYEATTFASGLGQGGPVAMTFGPSGRELYYTTYAGGDGGQIRSITYTLGNQAPNAAIEANPPHAQFPGDLTIDFAAAGSRDPDGDALTYAWDFDYDGQTFEADPNATGAQASHTYAAPGKRTAALRVTDGDGLSDIATIEVFPGNLPPEPEIQAPTTGERFRVGQQVELRGSATDAEDATAPALRWEVRRWHSGQHFHPFAQRQDGTLTFTAPAPEDLFATDPGSNYLELRLTATDSEGLSKTVTQRLEPKTVSVTFATRPINLRVVVNGRTFSASRTLLSWEGYGLNVNAPRQRKGGKRYVFRSWSDGRAANHVIVTPAGYTKYTATFRRR